jgi:peptidoglycan/LPS O-acetylase OafA/YrhL
MNAIDYRPDIDGLRAVAVSLVLLFHAGLGFSGGFIGVDVFFVISGFLITQLIRRELDRGTFALGTFWARRIGRIVPAATAMVVVVLGCGTMLLLPNDSVDLGRSAVAQQAMVANVYFWRTTGYFDGPADMKPLLHTWSLAVEEQFYLVYPLLLVWAHRLGRTAAVCVLGGLGTLSFAASVYGVEHHPSAAFFLLPFRAWELILGGLLCFVPSRVGASTIMCELTSAVSLVVIGGVGWMYDDDTAFPGMSALAPCCATAALIHANAMRPTTIGRLLALEPIVAVGRASYSLYLWHWPVLAFLRYWWPTELPAWAGGCGLAVGAVFAMGSYRFIEVPMRQLARSRTTGRVVGAGLVSTILMALAGYGLSAAGGFPFRLPAAARALLNDPVYGLHVTRSVPEWEKHEFPVIGFKDGGLVVPHFLVWGDSQAQTIADALDSVAEKCGVCGVIAAHAATVPIPGVFNRFSPPDEQLRRSQAVMRFIESAGMRNLILIADWPRYTPSKGRFALHAAAPGSTNPADGGDLLLSALDRMCADLEKQGTTIWIMQRVPCQRLEPRKRMAACAMFGFGLPSGISWDEYQRVDGPLNDRLKRMAARHAHVRLVDPAPSCFDSNGFSRIGDERGVFYRDPTHLSAHGAISLLPPVLEPVFESIKQSTSQLSVGPAAGSPVK